MVVPEARKTTERDAHRGFRGVSPGAAEARRRGAARSAAAFGLAPAACPGRLVKDVSWRTRQVPAERADREHEPVQVVVQVEVAREAGSGELGLVPGPVA